MADLFIPKTSITPENYKNFFSSGDFDQFSQVNNILGQYAPPNRLYVAPGQCTVNDPTSFDLQALPPETRKKIKLMVDNYGEDITLAIAELFDGIDVSSVTSNAIGLTGAVQGYASNRSSLIMNSMNEIKVLMAEHHKKLKNAAGGLSDVYAARAREEMIKMKVEGLNQRFSSEIRRFINKRKMLKRSPFVNPDRAANMARSSRNTTKFSVTSRAEFRKLVNMSRFVKVAGKGLIALDIGFRAYGVYDDYRNSHDYKRRAVGELAGGVTSITVSMAGFYAIGTVAAGIALSGPILVFALAVGAAVVLVGSTIAGDRVKSLAESLYDLVTKENKLVIDAYTYG
ncbi:hypothetical protein [Shewanella baltica]|uniref:hypothetical protein n=1 Tax=Shewanella baltica TaxID=62322 RepID=UPI00217CF020|nr:hypothetical protein [Shewanella baltica]